MLIILLSFFINIFSQNDSRSYLFIFGHDESKGSDYIQITKLEDSDRGKDDYEILRKYKTGVLVNKENLIREPTLVVTPIDKNHTLPYETKKFMKNAPAEHELLAFDYDEYNKIKDALVEKEISIPSQIGDAKFKVNQNDDKIRLLNGLITIKIGKDLKKLLEKPDNAFKKGNTAEKFLLGSKLLVQGGSAYMLAHFFGNGYSDFALLIYITANMGSTFLINYNISTFLNLRSYIAMKGEEAYQKMVKKHPFIENWDSKLNESKENWLVAFYDFKDGISGKKNYILRSTKRLAKSTGFLTFSSIPELLKYSRRGFLKNAVFKWDFWFQNALSYLFLGTGWLILGAGSNNISAVSDAFHYIGFPNAYGASFAFGFFIYSLVINTYNALTGVPLDLMFNHLFRAGLYGKWGAYGTNFVAELFYQKDKLSQVGLPGLNAVVNTAALFLLFPTYLAVHYLYPPVKYEKLTFLDNKEKLKEYGELMSEAFLYSRQVNLEDLDKLFELANELSIYNTKNKNYEDIQKEYEKLFRKVNLLVLLDDAKLNSIPLESYLIVRYLKYIKSYIESYEEVRFAFNNNDPKSFKLETFFNDILINVPKQISMFEISKLDEVQIRKVDVFLEKNRLDLEKIEKIFLEIEKQVENPSKKRALKIVEMINETNLIGVLELANSKGLLLSTYLIELFKDSMGKYLYGTNVIDYIKHHLLEYSKEYDLKDNNYRVYNNKDKDPKSMGKSIFLILNDLEYILNNYLNKDFEVINLHTLSDEEKRKLENIKLRGSEMFKTLSLNFDNLDSSYKTSLSLIYEILRNFIGKEKVIFSKTSGRYISIEFINYRDFNQFSSKLYVYKYPNYKDMLKEVYRRFPRLNIKPK